MAILHSERDSIQNVQRSVDMLRELYQKGRESWLPEYISEHFEDPLTVLIIYLIINFIAWGLLGFACCSFSDQVRRLRYQQDSRVNVLSETAKSVRRIEMLIDPESESLLASRIERLNDGSQRDLGFYRGFTGATWQGKAASSSSSFATPREPPMATSSISARASDLAEVEEEVQMPGDVDVSQEVRLVARQPGSAHTLIDMGEDAVGAAVRGEGRRSLCSTS